MGGTGAIVEDPKAPEQILTCLRARPPGFFVDFGCGSGTLLASARDLGWTAGGVEFDSDIVLQASARSRCVVFRGLEGLRESAPVLADVIHLGDVLEHLTAPLDVLSTLVGLLRLTGLLLVQGPLEARPCLFSTVLRPARRLHSPRPVEMPPNHVLRATVRGQMNLFERAGRKALEYRLSEAAWPAPGKLTFGVVRGPRGLGLFALRKVSQATSALAPARWGNRYFYVGVARHDGGSA